MTLTTASAHCPEIMTNVVDLPCQSCDTGQSLAAKGFCCRDFRSTLGSFATGVTVITALTADGEPIGMTISSFNSVSLDPPLILWSLALSSPALEAFRSARHYAVNVLAADQQAISNRFAARSGDRFAGVPRRTGLGGVPLLEGCCAWFECSNEAQYPGGDHLIFVGHVESFAQGEAASPLIFHGARYRQLETLATSDN
ncbi:flavin reductase family protein [Propionivibrio sp.]|uniref:flavin reductase family protein n=1 Tax=Propionivibrio sp. TaxID=2212460 RepID=UPI003BF16C45